MAAVSGEAVKDNPDGFIRVTVRDAERYGNVQAVDRQAPAYSLRCRSGSGWQLGCAFSGTWSLLSGSWGSAGAGPQRKVTLDVTIDWDDRLSAVRHGELGGDVGHVMWPRKSAQGSRFRASATVWRKFTPRWIEIRPDDMTPELAAAYRGRAAPSLLGNVHAWRGAAG